MPRSFGPVGRLLAVRARKQADGPLLLSFPGADFWRSVLIPRMPARGARAFPAHAARISVELSQSNCEAHPSPLRTMDTPMDADDAKVAEMAQNLKNELLVKQLWAGEHFFGRSGWQGGEPLGQPDTADEYARCISYWVCCAVTTENAATGPNYRNNLDWTITHLKSRIDWGIKYMDEHPEQQVSPLNLVTPDDNTVFHRAVRGAAAETLRLLLTHRAERTVPNINVVAKGATALGLLLRLGLDTPKRVACFWVLIDHMLAHNTCDNSYPIPLWAFREMKTDPAKFASFQAKVAEKFAAWRAAGGVP